MGQPKAGGRLNPYSATSHNASRSIAESNLGHKVVSGTVWRIFITISHSIAYMCKQWYENASCHKHHPIAIAAGCCITVGKNTVAKATENF